MMPSLTRLRTLSRRSRIIAIIAGGLLLLVLALLILGATFPASWLKSTAQQHLSKEIGTSVTIDAVERESAFSLSPVLRIAGIHIPQPTWAGGGDLARVEALRVRLPLLAMVFGGQAPELLSARGVRLTLIRDKDGRKSWRQSKQDKAGDDAGDDMTVHRVEDAIIDYRDAKQMRRFLVKLSITPGHGLRGSGEGEVEGYPVTLQLIGAPMVPGKSWPFDARIEGPALSMHAAGAMAGPLRTGDMLLKVSARASNLKLVDRIIEAGLFGTQPVNLRADVRHRDRTWTIGGLGGSVGRSQFSGTLHVRKQGDRTKLEGDARFSQLDFDDLADDRGKAQAAAIARAQGERIVPNSRVNIRKIDSTDGRITLRADRILSGANPSPITSLNAALSLDDRVLTIDPLRITLIKGTITGRAIVDQRQDQPKPKVTLALDMRNSSIAAVAGGGGSGGDIEGRVDARVRLTGVGDTIREAVGQSSGTVSAVTRGGSMPGRLAGLLGFNIGKGLFGDKDGREVLRCGVISLTVKGGRGTVDQLIVDTSVGQTRGSGTVTFPGEELALMLKGLAKNEHALQLPGTAKLGGTIRNPELLVPEKARSVGNILKAVGRAIGGRAETAPEADCRALIARTLG